MDNIEIVRTDLEISEDDVRACIAEFCDKEGIEDMRKAPQTIYTACMSYIGRRLFGGDTKGKNSIFIEKYINADGELKMGKSLNSEKLKVAAQYYLDLCRLYDKVCTLSGLCAFLGIGSTYLKENKDHELRQMIIEASESTASEVLLSGKRPPMSVLPYLNHFHGWQRDVSVQEEVVENKAKGLPDLSGYLPKKDG